MAKFLVSVDDATFDLPEPVHGRVDAQIDTRIGAFGTPRPAIDEAVLFVTPRGDDANDGRTLATAKATIPAAVAVMPWPGSGVVQLGAGTFTDADGFDLPGGVHIRGAGTGLTTYTYTGTGTAIRSASPGARTYSQTLSDLTVTGPGKATATVGIDLDSISMANLRAVTVAAFGTGFKFHSTINGGSVYNTLTACYANGCGTGYLLTGAGSNSNKFFGCRVNACDVGLDIHNVNATVWLGGQIEQSTVGVKFNGTTAALCSNNQVGFTRFESNTTAWEATSLAIDNQVIHPQVIGAYTFTDNGIRTTHVGISGNSARNVNWSVRQDALGSWRHVRTANGGAETPAFVVRDDNTAAGTPVTIQAETERPAGYFIRGTRAGVRYWDVNASGHQYLRNRLTVPATPTDGGVLFVEAGALKYIGSAGTITTIAPA